MATLHPIIGQVAQRRAVTGAGVYLILNTLNNKMYVGSSAVSVTKRWSCHESLLKHGRHSNNHLQAAWNKYGAGAFSFTVLEECSPDNSLTLEQIYIDLYETTDPSKGYNQAPTAGSNLGYKMSEASKEKMRNVPRTDEWRNRISASLIGRELSEHSRALISAARTGSQQTEETKKKISDSLVGNQYAVGHHHTEEMKLHLSECQIGKKKNMSEAGRQKLSEIGKANTGKIHSDETRAKLSAMRVGSGNSFYGKKHSEETKEKIRQTKLRTRMNKLLAEGCA